MSTYSFKIAQNKAKKTINIVAYATMLISFFWELYSMAPSPVKGLFSLGMWCGILCFPFTLIKHNDFSKTANFILKGLLIMAVILIARSSFNTGADMYAFGNKWITLFGNEYTALLLMAPLFAYLGTLQNSVHLLMKATWIFLVLGTIFSFAMKMPLKSLSIFIIVFLPFAKKKFIFLVGIVFIETIVSATVGENPGRMYLIVIAFALASYALIYWIKQPKVTKAFAIVVAIIPFIAFIPLLNLSSNGESFFSQTQDFIMGETQNQNLATDTRSFLYLEMAEDLSKENAWIFGKGAFSHYYSNYFDEGGIGKYGRLSSEVPFLNYLLRGGVLYVVFYFGLLLLAAYNAIWKGKSKFIQSVGIIVIGWYFNSFVGDITGCRFYHLAFFLLLGCCLSKKWLNYSDEEIKMLLRK